MAKRTIITTKSLLRLSCLAIILAIITGCATTSKFDIVPSLASGATRIEGDNVGAVTVRIVNASGWPLPFNSLYITPKNVNESEQVKHKELSPVSAERSSTQSYASTLEPGTYIVTSLSSFFTTQNYYYYSRIAPAGIQLGTFTIEPGKVTDLGTIIYYTKTEGDSYKHMVVRSPSQTYGTVLDNYFPDFVYAEEDLLHWNNDDLDDERNASYLSVVQNPLVFNQEYLAPNGSIYFLGKLGTIIERTAEGDWEIMAVDTDLDLQNIVQSNEGTLAVSGEKGKIYLKNKGADWQEISYSKNFTVREMFFSGKDQLDIITSGFLELKILRADLTSSPVKWNLQASYRPSTGWKNANGETTNIGIDGTHVRRSEIVDASVVKFNSRNYLFVKTDFIGSSPISRSHEYKAFTFDPTEWNIQEADNMQGIDRIKNLGVKQMGIKMPGFFSMTNMPVYYFYSEKNDEWEKLNLKHDNCPSLKASSTLCRKGGKTIKRTSDIVFASSPVFSDEQNGVVFAYLALPPNSDEEPEVSLFKTSDGGVSWKKTDKKPPTKYCYDLVSDFSKALLVRCGSVSSDFYESHNDGISWDHVREHQFF